jgi:ribonuclease HII
MVNYVYMPRWIIGVDEAGRGPLAGPVAVGLVAAPEDMDIREEFPGVADSKKLTAGARETLYALVEMRARRGDIKFCARFSSHKYIDTYGLTRAVERGVASGLKRLDIHHRECRVVLDGLLTAPGHFVQETIIRGDDLVPIISLASIVAKVRRDRLMRRMAAEHPQWGFEIHKGYPTPAHYAAIEEWGLSTIHRRRFCKNILIDTSPETGVMLEPEVL